MAEELNVHDSVRKGRERKWLYEKWRPSAVISIPVLEDDISMGAIEMNGDLDRVYLHDILVGVCRPKINSYSRH